MALVPILNSATYVESSLSTYGFGAVAVVPWYCYLTGMAVAFLSGLFRCPALGGLARRAYPEAQPAEERTPRAYCAEIAFRLEGMSPVSRLKAREK